MLAAALEEAMGCCPEGFRQGRMMCEDPIMQATKPAALSLDFRVHVLKTKKLPFALIGSWSGVAGGGVAITRGPLDGRYRDPHAFFQGKRSMLRLPQHAPA